MTHLLPLLKHTIQKTKQQGHSQKSISVTLRRSPTTILRELTRNELGDGVPRTSQKSVDFLVELDHGG
jgi:IS30 family transposase